MNQLKIDDLNFCEVTLPSKSEIKGGLGYSATYDTSVDSAHYSGYVANYYANPGSYGYVIGGQTSGAVAGGVAGAIAVGGVTYTSTGAVASAS